MDKMIIELLDDGSFKIVTGRISGANHVNAEGLVRALIDGAGGKATRQRRVDAGHGHVHEHGHEHEEH